MASYAPGRGGDDRAAGAADGPGRLAGSRLRWLAVVAVLVVAAALRLYRIDTLPPGLNYDEGANGVDALRVLQGQHPIFFEGNQGREPLYIYLVALSFRLFGPGPVSIRLVSVALGLLTVLSTYLLARELFGPRVGLLAALLAATTFWPVALSRLGLRAVTLPLFEALAAYLLWRGARRRQLWCYALAGLAAGLGLYTYLASRAMPLWLGAFGLALAIPAWRPGLSLRRHALGLALLAAVAAITFAPLARYYVGHLRQFVARVEAAGLETQARLAETPPDSLPVSALETLGMFVWQGDTNARYNVPGRPVFDPFVGAAFLVGVALALWRVARPEYALLLLWSAAMLLPGVLASEAPHSLRTVGVYPAALVFPAIGLDAAWRLAERGRLPALRSLTRLGLALGLALSVGLTLRDYFVVWAARADVYYAFSGDSRDAGRLGAQLADRGLVLLSSLSYRNVALPGALYPDRDRLSREFSGFEGVLLPGPESVPGDVYYVIPRTVAWGDAPQCRLIPCAEPFAVLRDPEGGEAATAYRVPAGTLEWPRPSRQLVARLGDHFDLLGYDLDRVLGPGDLLRLTLYLRLGRPLAEVGYWQLFAHLVDPQASRNAASAYVDASQSSWRTGDLLVAWLDLRTRRSLAPGLYQVHFGVVEPTSQRRQRIVDGAGRDVGDVLVLGPVRAQGPTAPPPEASSPVDFRLGDQVRLVGYDLDPAPRAGDGLRLTLYWQAAGPVPEDYTVFVHLVDGAGQIVAQRDAQPRAGQLPTGVWMPGEIVTDEYGVPLAASLAGQRLQVLVGMYKLETGQRLPVRDARGSALGDAIRLADVRPK